MTPPISIRVAAIFVVFGMLLVEGIVAAFGELSLEWIAAGIVAPLLLLGYVYLLQRIRDAWLRSRGERTALDKGRTERALKEPTPFVGPFRYIRFFVLWLLVVPIVVFAVAALISEEVWLFVPGVFIGMSLASIWVILWFRLRPKLEEKGMRW